MVDGIDFGTEIVNRCIEEHDKFIFEQVEPFCNRITQRIITKKDLEQALINYFPKERIKVEDSYQCYSKCPKCLSYISLNSNFCEFCGQHLKDAN